MAVNEYTFVFSGDSPEPLFTHWLSFAEDEEAIREAKELLEAQSALRSSQVRTISVARGSGDEPEWLGCWSSDADEALAWHPEE